MDVQRPRLRQRGKGGGLVRVALGRRLGREGPEKGRGVGDRPEKERNYCCELWERKREDVA